MILLLERQPSELAPLVPSEESTVACSEHMLVTMDGNRPTSVLPRPDAIPKRQMGRLDF